MLTANRAMPEHLTETENVKRSMSEGVVRQNIVTGTCNHYFTVYRRFRQWDQKVGGFWSCKANFVYLCRLGCSPAGVRLSTRLGRMVAGMGRGEVVVAGGLVVKGD